MANEIEILLDSNQEEILSPLKVLNGESYKVIIRNTGSEPTVDLGIYVVPATIYGEGNFKTSKSPETDFNDIISWGQQNYLENIAYGGLSLYFEIPSDDPFDDVIRLGSGDNLTNKIMLPILEPGDFISLMFTLTLPPSESTRIVVFDIVAE